MPGDLGGSLKLVPVTHFCNFGKNQNHFYLFSRYLINNFFQALKKDYQNDLGAPSYPPSIALTFVLATSNSKIRS